MIWPTRQKEFDRLVKELKRFSEKEHPLPGIDKDDARETLALQMIASLRRLDYTKVTRSRDISASRMDPNKPMFDPEKAALLYARSGNLDEAIWLTFLATHIGKHGKFGWRRLREIYSALGKGHWSWQNISNNPKSFRTWMEDNHHRIGGAFGNHRKYESLRPDSAKGTVAVIESFMNCTNGNPSKWFADLVRRSGNDPHTIFATAYREFATERFGRLAKFDFLALLGRLDLVPMSPGSAYLKGATGPLRGSRLLIDCDENSRTPPETLDELLKKLDKTLKVGMQVMEDSICNWQKSPTRFKHFKG